MMIIVSSRVIIHYCYFYCYYYNHTTTISVDIAITIVTIVIGNLPPLLHISVLSKS